MGIVWVQQKPESKTAFGYDIYLGSQFRFQGIRQKVMTEFGKKLNALGIEPVEICVFENNKIARQLYASIGLFLKKAWCESLFILVAVAQLIAYIGFSSFFGEQMFLIYFHTITLSIYAVLMFLLNRASRKIVVPENY